MLEKVVTNGTLAWHANATKQSSEADRTLAASIWLTLQHVKTGSYEIGANTNQPPFGNLHPARQWLSQNLTGSIELSDAVVSELASHVVRQKRAADWIEFAAADSPCQKVYRAVVESLREKDDLNPLPLRTLLNHYGLIRSTFGNKTELVLERTGGVVHEDHVEDLDLRSIPITLLRDTATRKEDGWKLFHTAIEDALTKISDEDWKTHLTTDSAVLGVLSVEATLRGFKLPAHRFKEPLSDLIIELLSGQAELSERPNLTGGLLDTIPPKARAAMPKAIADRTGGVSTNKETFGYVQAKFSDLIDNVFSKSSDDSKVRNFATPAIASATEQGASFVERHSRSLKSALSKVGDEQRGHFVEVIESVRSEFEPLRIHTLAKKVGIELTPLAGDEDDGSDTEEA